MILDAERSLEVPSVSCKTRQVRALIQFWSKEVSVYSVEEDECLALSKKQIPTFSTSFLYSGPQHNASCTNTWVGTIYLDNWLK